MVPRSTGMAQELCVTRKHVCGVTVFNQFIPIGSVYTGTRAPDRSSILIDGFKAVVWWFGVRLHSQGSPLNVVGSTEANALYSWGIQITCRERIHHHSGSQWTSEMLSPDENLHS